MKEDLLGVWGASGTDVFAVGRHGTVLRRQNARWRQLESGTEEDLYGVWGTGPDHVVVVGANCTVLQFDGEVEPSQDGGESPPSFRKLNAEKCNTFYAIDGLRADSALVVGEGPMQQYNGSRLASFNDCGSRMLGVSVVQEGEAFASGDRGVFCHLREGRWEQTTLGLCPVDLVDGQCPLELMPPVLWDVWVGSEGKGLAVGTFGGMWRFPKPEQGVWEPVDTRFSNELRAVHGWVDKEAPAAAATDPTEFFAVGTYGVTVRLRGEKLAREAIGNNENLRGVWVSPEGQHVYVVGDSGTIAHLIRK